MQDVLECVACKKRFVLFVVADRVPMSCARGEAVEQGDFVYCPFCGADNKDSIDDATH